MVKSFLIQSTRAICEALVVEMKGKLDNSLTERCTGFILEEREKMQPVYKMAFGLMLFYFDLIQIIRYGEIFRRLPIEVRLNILERWRGSSLYPKRVFMKLVLSLTVISFYDAPEVLSNFGINTEDYLKMVRLYNSNGMITDGILSLKKGDTIRCECLVIGSGAGGALTASYLAEAGKNVLIAEEGPLVRVSETGGITESFPAMWREGGIMPILGNSTLVFSEGRCLGGSTMVNAGLIHRLPEEIVSEWAVEHAVQDLDHKIIHRHHDTVEKELHVHQMDDSENRTSQLFREGARKTGFRGFHTPVAGKHVEGKFRKSNMQETFLKRAAEAGAWIITDCRVDRIVFRGRRAVEIQAVYTDVKGETYPVTIQFDQIFVCAGATQTPLLLERSGVKKNIGNNLRFHPTLRVLAEFDSSINAHLSEMAPYQIKEFSPDISMGASVSLPPFLATGLSFNWQQNKRYLERLNNMASYYVMIRTRSRARVRNSPLGKSSYRVKYDLDAADVRNLSFGFAKLCEVLLASGAKRLYPSVEGLSSLQSQKESDYYLKENLPLKKLNLMTIHAFSSCPMGENRDISAVDSYGRLHGFENIFVNDASILPSSPSVNPQGPIMALALRNIENFLK